MEGRFARWIHRRRIGAEVVVERNVLLENDHHMLDGMVVGGSAASAAGAAAKNSDIETGAPNIPPALKR
jgi:hypothetical protein